MKKAQEGPTGTGFQYLLPQNVSKQRRFCCAWILWGKRGWDHFLAVPTQLLSALRGALVNTAVELLPWQAAEHLLVSPLVVVSRLLISVHAKKPAPMAVPGNVPTLHTLGPRSVCPEVLGSAQVLAASSGARGWCKPHPILILCRPTEMGSDGGV